MAYHNSSLSSPNQNNAVIPQQQNLAYSLHIKPFQDLQRQFQWPCFPNAYPSPQVISHHRQKLYHELTTLWITMIQSILNTFKLRLRCPRCNQSPLTEFSSSFMEMNHSLPRKGLQMWRRLRRETEGVDLIQFGQGDLDFIVRGLDEIEMLYWEDGVGGGECGLMVWNGGRGEPPLG